MAIKFGYEKADSDGLYYRKEDTTWGCPPSNDDPGWIIPKPGAVPVSQEEACDNIDQE